MESLWQKFKRVMAPDRFDPWPGSPDIPTRGNENLVERLRAPVNRTQNYIFHDFVADMITLGPFDPLKLEAANRIEELESIMDDDDQDISRAWRQHVLDHPEGLSLCRDDFAAGYRAAMSRFKKRY